MKKKDIFILAILIVVSVLVCLSEATPIQWQVEDGGNGHYYERIDFSGSWYEAKQVAEECIYLGVSGHLATITSQAENDFITQNLVASSGEASHFLGGYQDESAPDYSEPGGGWRWVTGETWNYTNWAPAEPTNSRSIEGWYEDGLIMWYLTDPAYQGNWNDIPRVNPIGAPSFIVEYDITEPALVAIDIKPGSYPNAINLGSRGLTPVAILSELGGFNATSVDPNTVTLSGALVARRGKGGEKFMAHEEDVNADGLVDLVVQVATANLDPNSLQDGWAILTASTYDGQAIEGWDEIIIVPPEQ